MFIFRLSLRRQQTLIILPTIRLRRVDTCIPTHLLIAILPLMTSMSTTRHVQVGSWYILGRFLREDSKVEFVNVVLLSIKLEILP